MKLSLRSEDKQKISGFLGKKWVTWFISGFMILFTAGMLAYLVYRQRDVLLSYSWDLNWSPLVIALGVHLALLLLGAYVWAEILNALGPRISFLRHFRVFCMNMMARRIPGTFWYVVYRAQAYQQHGFSVKATSLASGVELAVSVISGGVTTFIIASFIGLRFSPWLLIAILGVGILLLNPRTLKWLFKKLSMQQVEIPISRLLRWIFMYILLWVMGGTIVMLIINVFTPLAFSKLAHVIGYWALIGTMTQLLAFLPSNFGLSEVSLSLLLSTHVPSSIAVIIAIATRIIFLAFELFWSFIALFLVKERS